jgi:hypothetical protein
LFVCDAQAQFGPNPTARHFSKLETRNSELFIMTAELTVGTRIYRPFHLQASASGSKLIMDTPSWQYFADDGTTMVRAKPAADRGWQVVPWEETGGRVCVCDETIPEDWTYFEVLFADVNFVAVSPVAGDPEELRRVAQAG